jgi:putative redox protein
MSTPLHTASAVTGTNAYRTDIVAGTDPGFTFQSDAPRSTGGLGASPSPVELLTAALAACKTMTAQMYAQRKGWPIRSVRVEARHVKKDADGSARDAFECDIWVEGDLSDEQRRRVYEITARCPVHLMLEASTPVVSHLHNEP